MLLNYCDVILIPQRLFIRETQFMCLLQLNKRKNERKTNQDSTVSPPDCLKRTNLRVCPIRTPSCVHLIHSFIASPCCLSFISTCLRVSCPQYLCFFVSLFPSGSLIFFCWEVFADRASLSVHSIFFPVPRSVQTSMNDFFPATISQSLVPAEIGVFHIFQLPLTISTPEVLRAAAVEVAIVGAVVIPLSEVEIGIVSLSRP